MERGRMERGSYRERGRERNGEGRKQEGGRREGGREEEDTRTYLQADVVEGQSFCHHHQCLSTLSFNLVRHNVHVLKYPGWK